MHYIVIENENGFMVTQVKNDQTNEDAAILQNGVVVDPTPYKSFDDAYDAMQLIPVVADREPPGST